MSTMLDEYLKYHEKYKLLYGEKSLILLQNGGFFEIFSVMNDESTLGPNIYEICNNILNIMVSRRDKKVKEITKSNHLMAGFPLHALNKYTPILLDNGYTIVLIEQITKPPNPDRQVTKILSPGTVIENYNNKDNNYLMSIFIEKNEYQNKDIHTVGISLIDISTGKNYISHIMSNIDDINHWKDEIQRIIINYDPIELIIHTDGLTLTEEYIINNFSTNASIQINHYSQNKSFKKITFQNEFLQKIFTFTNMLSPIENLNLERYPETVLSYIYLLQYIYEHTSNLINKIEIPVQLDDLDYCILPSDTARQLNIINNNNFYKGKNESLLSIINKCKTPMGRRICKERLLYPSINSEILQKRYDLIDIVKQNNLFVDIRKELTKINDLEKSIRKMSLDLYESNELFSDYLSYDYIIKTINIIKENDELYNQYLNYEQDFDKFIELNKFIEDTFEFDNFSSVSSVNVIERSLFKKHIFYDIDNIDDEINNYKQKLDFICNKLSDFIDSKKNTSLPLKIEYNDKHNWFIYTTKKRGLMLKERFKNLNNKSIIVKDDDENIIYEFKPSDFSFKTKDNNNTIIELNEIKDISNKLIELNKELSYLNNKYYIETIQNIYSKYNVSLKRINDFLADIDFITNGAKISIDNNYFKPEIVDAEKSFIDCKDIRHPICEQINTSIEYITNDIELGINDNDGILLYGCNACGKSTCIKAIGINIIMAQCGYFVASKHFKFKPYKQIFSRILNNDNIFKSQSSFAVEMSELRSILHNVNENSLVLGDELCSGTETISALSIVSTGLKFLSEKKCSFAFTSHLHQLHNISIMKDIKNLNIFHLKIRIENDILIYDRKLERGPGPTLYGLLVSEAMGLPKDFISTAKQVELELTGESKTLIDTKKSNYNSNIIMDRCKMCNEKAQEVHHIFEQQDADENNMCGHFHKNNEHNLVPLCKKCHAKITYGELHIKGYLQTSEGLKLDYEYIKNKQSNRKKYNQEQIDIILDMNSKYSILSKKDIIKKIESEHNIKISLNIFNKIINNNY